MGDFTLAPSVTLLCGRSGSGKTTFLCRLLAANGFACRFVFDDLGRVAGRLGVAPCYSAGDCERALAGRWVVFNPHKAFPGDVVAAFRWFAAWAFQASRRGPGRKVFALDESWQFMSPQSLPRELALIAQAGREEGLELVAGTQRPSRINDSLAGNATELVCFSLLPGPGLDRAASLGADAAEVAALPLGAFVSYNLVKPGKLRGRVF